MDGEVSNLGKFSACRRVARTIYLGSAPTTTAAHRGLEDRQVKLGCVMPGESPAVFGDALRRLAGAATFLYQDGPRYWYSTQPTVTKLAEDRAEQLKREPDKVVKELEDRLRADVQQAETQRKAADGTVTARLPETFQWLLVPTQASPQSSVELQAFRLSGSDALAVRASKKLRGDELLLTSFAGTRLRMELDRVPLWREHHVAIKQLADDFARYPYLPRLRDSSVLL